MKTLLSILILFFSTSTVYARLGWTKAQMEKKYGKPINIEVTELGIKQFTYESGRWTIIASFIKNKVHFLMYGKSESKDPKSPLQKLSNDDVIAVLRINLKTGTRWVIEKEKYLLFNSREYRSYVQSPTTTEEPKLLACSRLGIGKKIIIVETAEWVKFEIQKKTEIEGL